MIEFLGSTSTLFSLAAEFLKTRKEQAGSLNADDFRNWLEREVFPLLLQNSDQLLASVISMKAQNTEQYQTMIGLLTKLQDSISPKSNNRFLNDRHWQILTVLSVAFGGNPIEVSKIAESIEIDALELKRALGLLEELGLAKVLSATQRSAARTTSKGYLKSSLRSAPEESNSALARVLACLPRETGSIRLGTLASTANVSVQFLHALLDVWGARNLLSFENNAGSPEHATVRRVKHMLFEETFNQDLAVLTES